MDIEDRFWTKHFPPVLFGYTCQTRINKNKTRTEGDSGNTHFRQEIKISGSNTVQINQAHTINNLSILSIETLVPDQLDSDVKSQELSPPNMPSDTLQPPETNRS